MTKGNFRLVINGEALLSVDKPHGFILATREIPCLLLVLAFEMIVKLIYLLIPDL
jgi:hypothetical protein